MRYPVSEPDLSTLEEQYVNDAIKSTWISSTGKYLEQFESKFSEIIGTEQCLAVANGTVALELILRGLGIGEGDEVIVPSFTYIASVNAIRYVGATPVFAEVSDETWGLDPDKLGSLVTPRTTAVIAVHLYGHPVHLEEVSKFCLKNSLHLIEDAAEAPFSSVKSKPVGGWGVASSFSFYGNKVITSGEGGAICTNNNELAKRIKILKNQGMDPARRYVFPVIGHNYRLTNVAAAILCAQLERLDGILDRRRAVTNRYDEIFSNERGLSLQPKQSWAEWTPWISSVLLDSSTEFRRDTLMSKLASEGIETRPLFYPVHTMEPYLSSDLRVDLSYSSKLAISGFSLPTSSKMSPSDAEKIATTLLRLI